jgi:DNA-binding NtrC family response regulator
MMRVGSALIRLPPLRERPEDARELARHFVAEAARELAQPSLKPSAALLDEVTRRPWPGNVRELRGAVRDATRRAAFHGALDVAVDFLPPPTALFTAVGPMPPTPLETMLAASPLPSSRPPESAPPPPSPSGVDFTAQELAELHVLRRHRFHMAPSEAELGLSQKSRTLTNHLRGFCFKALQRTGFDVARASAAVAGGHDDALAERLQARIYQYLATVRENVAAGTIEKLLNNLPRDYHRAIDEAVQRAREERLPQPPPSAFGVTGDGDADT